MPSDLKIFTDDEVAMLLSGDRREVDKLLLHGINNLSSALIPMLDTMNELGTAEQLRKRMEWIDVQIENQRVKNAMMRKVSESALIWAAIGFLGFLLLSGYNYSIEVIRAKLTLVK